MRLPRFSHFSPGSLKEACSLLAEHREKARVIAGGTDLLVNMKQRVTTPTHLVNLKNIAHLDFIDCDDKTGLTIGSLATLGTIENSPLIKEKFPILSQAASKVGATQLRQMGTLGGNICLDTRCWHYNQSHFWRKAEEPCYKLEGNLCHMVKGGDHCYALFSADTVPALIALKAKVKIVDLQGEKIIPLEELYTGKGEKPIILDPDQILTEVQIPNPSTRTQGVYLKLSVREAINYPLLGAAVQLTLEGKNGICTEVRIVLTAVTSGPQRAIKAEEGLKGEEIKEETIEEASEAAKKEAHPISHLGMSASHKREMVKGLVKWGLNQIREELS